MSKITSTNLRRVMRHNRVRAKISGTAERPRLCVFKSNKYVYAALVDDTKGKTLMTVTSAKTKAKATKENPFRKVIEASLVGKQIGELAKKAGISQVVFDRAGFRFTGRVKAVADGARESGLVF